MNIEEIDSKIDPISRIIASSPDEILSVILLLKEKGFNILIDLFAVDYPEREKRIEVIYSLLDIASNKRVYVKVGTSLDESIPSIVNIFQSANWFEREVFDMYGVNFANHPKLERILTDYGFEGHPMLKNFPLTGYKEVRYDIASKKVIYDDVNLSQDYRSFDFLTPWQGTDISEKDGK